jgi:hypothetical protein
VSARVSPPLTSAPRASAAATSTLLGGTARLLLALRRAAAPHRALLDTGTGPVHAAPHQDCAL